MPTSSLSTAQAARAAIATRLDEMRKDAGLTGLELAQRCGWHKAKTSRIARAKTAPSDADIRAWCRACGAEEQAADLIAASRTAESMTAEVNITAPGEIRTYLRAFAELSAIAVHGAAARACITRALGSCG